jgi:branched-chain amino acid transport system ATP-binding protein
MTVLEHDGRLASRYESEPPRGSARNAAMRREEEASIERAHDALRYVGMEGFADRYANALSFGQQRIIEIARTLIDRPRVILLDEPAVGLSPPRVAELTQLLPPYPQGEGHPAGDN